MRGPGAPSPYIGGDYMGVPTATQREVMERAMNGEFSTLPEYCKAWRESYDITQADVAEKCGLTVSSVCKFESGVTRSYRVLMGYMYFGMPYPYDLARAYFTGR